MERARQKGDAGLAARLIIEEALETVNALGFHATVKLGGKFELTPLTIAGIGRKEVDLIEVIDGLCDTIYVCYWAACALKVELEPFLDEVCTNNLLKTVNPRFDETGKLVKPDGHPRPALKRIYETLYVPRWKHEGGRFIMRLKHRDAFVNVYGVVYLVGEAGATLGVGKSLTEVMEFHREEFGNWEMRFI